MLTRVEKTSVNENELCSQYMRWYLIGFEYVCIPGEDIIRNQFDSFLLL